ncbi:3945_t:CDS:2, partial [Acaulospora morrowiae]
WILKTFGANADTTKACFDDILKTRVSINEQLIQDLNSELPPNGWTKCSYKLQLIFGRFSAIAMESTTTYYLNVEDSNNQETNDQNAEGQHEESSVNITLPIDCNYTTSKSDHKILESDEQDDELFVWFEVLSNLNVHLMISSDGKLATYEFKQHLRAFMDKIDASQFKNNKRRPFDLVADQSRKKQRNKAIKRLEEFTDSEFKKKLTSLAV